jgi:hypothetical protein
MTYEARTLLLLQESGGNPFVREAEPNQIKRERLGGLNALLKSDNVLAKVLVDIGTEDALPETTAFAVKIQNLRRALDIDLIGTNLLEIRLKGSKSRGLGKELEAVTIRFLEALTSDRGLMSAGQILIHRHQEETQAAEKALADLKARLNELFPDGYRESAEQLRTIQLSLDEKSLKLAAVEKEIAQFRIASPTGRDSQGDPSADRAQNGADSEISVAQGVGTAMQSSRLTELNDARTRRDELAREVDQLAATRDRVERSIKTFTGFQEQILFAEKRLAVAQEAYQTSLRRDQNPVSRPGLSILNAPEPERIKMIDAPKDPGIATRSRFLVVLSGLAASVLLGIGLAWGAEILDQTIRHADELAVAAGAPVMAVLPRITSPPSTTTEPIAAPKRRRRNRRVGLLLLRVLGTAAVGYVIATPSGTSSRISRALLDWIYLFRSWLDLLY